MTNYIRFKLNNGIEVVAEPIDYVRSVSIGLFVRSGVLYESEELQGVSHFIEHMMFKGTANRKAVEIAGEFDRIGGMLNAFTSKDHCCYFARVVMDKLDVALDILSDMLKNSSFDNTELERERGVILEEIKMYEDSPDEIIHELLGRTIWKNSKLGNPILGSAKTVGSMDRDSIVKYFSSQYTSQNLLLCVAGNFDPEHLKELAEAKLSDMRSGIFEPCSSKSSVSSNAAVYLKDIEQVHLTLGCEGAGSSDRRRYSLGIINAAFGGGMSSRLFQEVREKRGMAYTVYSYHTHFKDTGLFGIYAGTSPAHLPKVLELIYDEVTKLADEGLTEKEISDTKEQFKGSVMLSLEGTTNRMMRLNNEFLYGMPIKSPEEDLEPYMNVTAEDIKETAKEMLDVNKMAAVIVGPSEEAAGILANSSFARKNITIEHLGSKGSN